MQGKTDVRDASELGYDFTPVLSSMRFKSAGSNQ